MPCHCVLLAYVGLSIWDGLPRTLNLKIEDWQNESWGIHDIDRRTIQCEIAISANGSRMNRCDSQYFHHFFISAGSSAERTLYLHPTRLGYTIDDGRRIADGGECRCTWNPERLILGDSNCGQTAKIRIPDGKQIAGARIANAWVVQYRDEGIDGTVHQLALAPELGCEVMEEIVRKKGTLGIPGAYWHYLVTMYKPGEPDKSRFQVPDGYSVKTKRD